MKANNNVTTSLGAKFHGAEFQISWCVWITEHWVTENQKISGNL